MASKKTDIHTAVRDYAVKTFLGSNYSKQDGDYFIARVPVKMGKIGYIIHCGDIYRGEIYGVSIIGDDTNRVFIKLFNCVNVRNKKDTSYISGGYLGVSFFTKRKDAEAALAAIKRKGKIQ